MEIHLDNLYIGGAITLMEDNTSVVKWAETTNVSSAEFTIWNPATTNENRYKSFRGRLQQFGHNHQLRCEYVY